MWKTACVLWYSNFEEKIFGSGMFCSSDGKPSVALIGATGLVGRNVFRLIIENEHDWKISLFASKAQNLNVKEGSFKVLPVDQANFFDFDMCLFATEEDVSKVWIKKALHAGARVIDSSSWRRLDPYVPLIVPGVNHDVLKKTHNLCAHSNCVVSPLACVLAPVHRLYGLKCVHVATYQSVSGAGKQGLEACLRETKEKISETPSENHYFSKNIGFNVIPQIGTLNDEGHSSEEEKIQKELHRILQVNCPIFSTTVRVPVLQGHSCALWIEFERPWCIEEGKEAWRNASHLELSEEYQTPLEITGRSIVSLGRIRYLSPFHAALWICSDNILRGAASDMVDIAKLMVHQKNQ